MTLAEWRDELNELWLLGEKREHAADAAAISLRGERGSQSENGAMPSSAGNETLETFSFVIESRSAADY